MAHELWRLDQALARLDAERARLDAERTRLLGRRVELVGMLRGARTPAGAGRPVPPPSPLSSPPFPAPPVTPVMPGTPRTEQERRELSARATQNLLLILGGLLLAVAAVVFTVVSWGYLGIGGRAAVLAGATALVLAVPVPLLRRGLTATAETMGALGVAFMVLDGYAARRVGLAGVDRLAQPYYIALVCGLIALVLVLYARFVRLRLPLPIAVVFAQFAVVLPGFELDYPALGCLVAATLDTLLWLRLNRGGTGAAVRRTAAVCAAFAGALGALVGAIEVLMTDGSLSRTLGPSFRLFLFAAAGLIVALLLAARDQPFTRRPQPATAGGGIGGEGPDHGGAPGTGSAGARPPVRGVGRHAIVAAMVAGAAIVVLELAAISVLRYPLESWETGWRLVACMVMSMGLGVAAQAVPERVVRRAVGITATVLAVLWALPMVPGAIAALASPVRRAVLSPWEQADLWFNSEWPSAWPAAPVAALLLAVAAVVIARRFRGGTADQTADHVAEGVALFLAALAVAVAPVAYALPFPLATGVVAGLVVVLAGLAVVDRRRGMATARAVLAGGAGVLAVAWAVADETATLIMLPVLAVVAAAVAVTARVTGFRPHAAALVTALVGAEVLAVCASAGWRAAYAAFPLLAVACLAALAAALLARRTPRPAAATGVEVGAYVLVACGVLLTLPDLRLTSLACAVAGLLAAGTALRRDRRGDRGPLRAAAALLLLSGWLRLGVEDVTTVEAYTVPFSLVLLAFGWWRARKNPGTSSWSAYGPGLSFTMLPSLVAVFVYEDWRRPLLLGGASLAVLLWGARKRLQAPAVVGGLTLVCVVLHELSPWISELVLLLPRWVPIAVGGALLVAVGATYEARKRDVRRLRDVLTRMR
ncbi:hypothetical protein [Spongiactinospora sp. TRM90649]|uniref:SCO7613 C-terminal domain-containing membrane protein n=1 Tax=Spongiactinospora sp. TRM90649 TaxID=3031114 RepID=UPI0023FA20CC|nr:hypothetical protein [Spongiactinospora sp. TRM90649]MDF5757794.1 hypothetical protein [Spongiactinospora sp. TRM90649]